MFYIYNKARSFKFQSRTKRFVAFKNSLNISNLGEYMILSIRNVILVLISLIWSQMLLIITTLYRTYEQSV